MLKRFWLILIYPLFILGCDNYEKDNTEKMLITAKMQEKVQKVSAELKAYCDSEIYRKARWKADSILAKHYIK